MRRIREKKLNIQLLVCQIIHGKRSSYIATKALNSPLTTWDYFFTN